MRGLLFWSAFGEGRSRLFGVAIGGAKGCGGHSTDFFLGSESGYGMVRDQNFP
jgi:hypothetical protein